MQGNCRLDIPYPPIEVEKPNLIYAQLLLHDYAGPHGELSAITQYFYQYLIMQTPHKEFADALRCISEMEMHHLDIVGQLITYLGGNPLYRTVDYRRSNYWCGYNVLPTQEILRFLRENIEGENIAIRNYRRRITQIKDAKIKSILERIIQDEEHHIEIFNHYIQVFTLKESL